MNEQNFIHWPCEGLPYRKTVRAKLYGHDANARVVMTLIMVACIVGFFAEQAFGCLFVLVPLWLFVKFIGLVWRTERKRDGALARKTFAPWREQWSRAERAAREFALIKDSRQAVPAFDALPIGPRVLTPAGERVWKRLHALPQLSPDLLRYVGADVNDGKFVEHYATVALAYLAWSWGRLGSAVVLRDKPHSIACYWEPTPGLHAFARARAVLVPGNPMLEVEDGYEFWIPEGAKIRRESAPTMTTPDHFRGEVSTFRPKSAFWNAFLRGYDTVKPQGFVGLESELTTDRHRDRHFLPECGDSLDLVVLYAARPFPVSVNAVMKKDGTPFFEGMGAHLEAIRLTLDRSITPALVESKRHVERELEQAARS
jgi:hypothetical protein